MVFIRCDNKSAVMVCDTGNTSNISNLCLQPISAHASKYNVDLRVRHLPICNNVMADALSRHKFETKHPRRNFRKNLIFVLVEVH